MREEWKGRREQGCGGSNSDVGGGGEGDDEGGGDGDSGQGCTVCRMLALSVVGGTPVEEE